MAVARPKTWFFFALALVMVTVVAIGFGPTLYLRPWFSQARIPPPEQLVHGLVLTAWFTFFGMQAFLVSSGRTRTHMQLGIAGAALAIAVVISSLVTMREAAQRVAAAGVDLRPRVVPVIVSDFWVLVVFALLVGAAVIFRARAATHKRLMLLASVMLIGPALSTVRPVGRLFVPYLPAVLRPSVLFIAVCIVALICFDVVKHRRIEPATLWGSAALLGAVVVTTFMAFSDAGVALTRWLTGVP